MAAVWLLLLLVHAVWIDRATQDAADAGLRQRRVSDVSSNDVSLDEAFELLQAWNSVLKLKSKVAARDDSMSADHTGHNMSANRSMSTDYPSHSLSADHHSLSADHSMSADRSMSADYPSRSMSADHNMSADRSMSADYPSRSMSADHHPSHNMTADHPNHSMSADHNMSADHSMSADYPSHSMSADHNMTSHNMSTVSQQLNHLSDSLNLGYQNDSMDDDFVVVDI
ncbi:uncharacterized protein LOC109513266 isoform X4 [Hippocampus comes]|uniref:uncharacterized protein LOC109513266 isoform X4 n=1 Tax=Hippocampus comes TaxID=109280 RepID=UPI00094E9683|nr:PREDICTED: uncharacterized protein LOC109513266 isoform X4 [Hippocampus comes]